MDMKAHTSGILLTIYKQHYMDHYLEQIEFDYSCWGYYDGMDINVMKESKKEPLHSSISDGWYNESEITGNFNGKFSQQTFCLFRYDVNDAAFWRTEQRPPFLAAVFVQIKDKEADYIKFKNQLENNAEFIKLGASCMVYWTFDNADMVLLVYGNSYAGIVSVLKEIEATEELGYTHPICGVSEKWLNLIENREAELNLETNTIDHEGSCLQNSDVAQIQMRFVGCQNPLQIQSKLQNALIALQKNYPKAKLNKVKCSYSMGHDSFYASISRCDIYTVLLLMIRTGLITHQSSLYQDVCYNIESNLLLEDIELEIKETGTGGKPKEDGTEPESNNDEGGTISTEKAWCESVMEWYIQSMKQALDASDEGLYSFYQAMIRTLNMLSQYEKFKLSSELFYNVFPALHMFDKQLRKAVDKVQDIKTPEIEVEKCKYRMKEALSVFIDSINSVIYHSVHTDQIFLMIPGYSGTTFSVPTKLNLFYLSFLDDVTNVLDQTWQYKCYITPGMERIPSTNIVDFGHEPGDRLICVNVSQRSMHFPNYMMIILAHEMAHYAGTEVRCRETRQIKIVKTLAYLLSKALVQGYDTRDGDLREYKAWMLKKLEFEIADYFEKELNSILESHSVNAEMHMAQFLPILTQGCRRLLVDEHRRLQAVIYNYTEGVLESKRSKSMGNYAWDYKLDKTDEEWKEAVYQMHELRSDIFKNIFEIVNGDKVSRMIVAVARLYQEVFSDVAAYALLGFTYDVYQETYNVSEGNRNRAKGWFTPSTLRKSIINDLVLPQSDMKTSEEINQKRADIRSKLWERHKSFEIENPDTLFFWYDISYDSLVYVWLKEYANECLIKINRQIGENTENISRLQNIKNSFRIFNEDQNDFNKIHTHIQQCIHQYLKKAREECKKAITSIISEENMQK